MICQRCRGNKGICGCRPKVGDAMYLLQPLKIEDRYVRNYLLPYLKKEGKMNMLFTVSDTSSGPKQVRFKELSDTGINYWYLYDNFEWI
jgi:hypothetical protein